MTGDLGDRLAPPFRSLDALLRAAFNQGVTVGARYPEEAALPESEREIQFRAFKDHVVGKTWTPDQWTQARLSAETRAKIARAETEGGLR